MFSAGVTGRLANPVPNPPDPSGNGTQSAATKQAQLIALYLQQALASQKLQVDRTDLDDDQASLLELESTPGASEPTLQGVIAEVRYDEFQAQDGVNADAAAVDTAQLKINVLSGETELYDTSNGNEPSLSDIHQGQYGDCYFLAALGSLAQEDPQAIKNMIHDNGDGTYTVTLYQNQKNPDQVGWPVKVTVNAMDIPYGAADETGAGPGSQVIDPNNGKQVLWVSVVEAAYAKLHDTKVSGVDQGLQSGYNMIGQGGNPAGPFAALTDDPAANYTPNSSSGLTAVNNLQSDLKAGDMIDVVTPDYKNGDSPYNLVGYHVYTLTSVSTENGVEYANLNNPWGSDQPQAIPLYELLNVSDDITVDPNPHKTSAAAPPGKSTFFPVGENG